jgi:hypothetical protein
MVIGPLRAAEFGQIHRSIAFWPPCGRTRIISDQFGSGHAWWRHNIPLWVPSRGRTGFWIPPPFDRVSKGIAFPTEAVPRRRGGSAAKPSHHSIESARASPFPLRRGGGIVGTGTGPESTLMISQLRCNVEGLNVVDASCVKEFPPSLTRNHSTLMKPLRRRARSRGWPRAAGTQPP